MNAWPALGLLFAINLLIAVADLFAKKAALAPERDWTLSGAAVGIWMVACFLWLPMMRAKGFTRLVALADVMGLSMLAILGYAFLGERLNIQEVAGLGCAVLAILLLGT